VEGRVERESERVHCRDGFSRDGRGERARGAATEDLVRETGGPQDSKKEET